MLDFSNVDSAEFSELKNIINKNVEKSDLDRFPLFSTDKFIKAKLFILCYRFLLNAHNLLLDSGLKNELKREIDNLKDTYEEICSLIDFLGSSKIYGKHLVAQKLYVQTMKPEVSDLIDIFAILTERVNIISMSRFKGVILEGKSGDEFNKIMKSDVESRED